MGQQVQELATADEATEFIKQLTESDKRLSDVVGRVGFEEATKAKEKETGDALRKLFLPEPDIAAAVRKLRSSVEQEQRDAEDLATTETGVLANDNRERFVVARERYRQAPGIVATFERDKGGMVEATLVQLWTLDHSIATTTEANLRGQLLTPVELHDCTRPH